MTRKEFSLIAAGLRETYRRDKLLDSKDAFDIWYELLKDLSYETASMAAQAYMMQEHFPPVPADIRKKAAELTEVVTGETMTEGEAWAMVRKAISNGIYGYAEEFEKMPEEIRKAIGTSKQIQIWAMDENFNEGVVQSQFLRSYRQVMERKKQTDLLPRELQERLMRIGTGDQALLEVDT